MTYHLELSRQARRALTTDLPATAAAACFEFLSGPLAENPRRVGKPLRAPLEGCQAARRGEYRIIYRVVESRELVQVLSIRHRRNAYRTP